MPQDRGYEIKIIVIVIDMADPVPYPSNVHEERSVGAKRVYLYLL